MISFRLIIKGLVSYLARFLSFIPCRYIVFESLPDYADNTRAVFDEMVRRGLNKKYRFIWNCVNPNTKIPIDGVKCVYKRYFQIFYMMRAKCLISCNSFLSTFGKYQKSIYLCHGVPLKSLRGYKAPHGIDCIIGLSEDTNHIQSKELGIKMDKFQTLGYPRNDALLNKTHDDISQLFGNKFDKYIVWYPTFRQHCTSRIVSATSHALPIIYNTEIAKIINDFAAEKNVLIILKPHFSQDTKYIKELKLSNIIFIDDNFFIYHKITSYEFVGGCDALITDYSSIYFDYLLCDKPVAAIWEDVEEYKKNRGFAIDIDYYMKGAFKIYNVDDFLTFLEDVSFDKDTMKKERNLLIDVIHKNKDFNSAIRVVDFIESALLK